MTIDCQDPGFRELLPDLAHGRLDAGDRARAEAHVAACEACARELGIVRAARASLSRVPAIDTGRIVAALPAAPARAPLRVERGGAAGAVPAPRWWRAPSAAMRIAAGIAALAVGGAGLRVALDGGDAPPQRSVVAAGEDPVVPAATPATPAGEPGTGQSVGAAIAAASPAATSPAGSASRGAQGAAPGGMSFGGGVSDLSDEALHALLDDLENVDAVPSAEPESDLLPVGLEEG